MNNTIQRTVDELAEATGQANLLFGQLTAQQLNWKPAADKWSVAQCLDHLIVSNTTYFPQFEEVASGKHKNTFYQNIGFISRFWGEQLLKDVGPVVNRNFKNPAIFTPSQSDIDSDIVNQFSKHQAQLTGIIKKLDGVDLNKTVINSPVTGLIVYNLTHVLGVITAHEQRHIQQARRVMDNPSFPA